MSSWGIQHLYRDAAFVPSLEKYGDNTVLAGIFCGSLLISLSYPALHNLFMRHSLVYSQKLASDQRVVVVQHAIEALFFATWFLPTTYLAACFNFQLKGTAEEFAPKAKASSIYLGTVLILYCLELNSRIYNLRPIIALHHVGACLVGIVCTLIVSEATIITATLLVYFIGFEAIIFAGLVLYRLGSQHAASVMWVGMCVFGASRPIQVLMVMASLIVNRDHIVVWQGIASAAITLLFTALQVYTLTIHYKIYQKCRKIGRDACPSPSYGAIATGVGRQLGCSGPHKLHSPSPSFCSTLNDSLSELGDD